MQELHKNSIKLNVQGLNTNITKKGFIQSKEFFINTYTHLMIMTVK